MTSYPCLHELTDTGLELFRRVMTGQASEIELDCGNRRLAWPVEDTRPFEARAFVTAREMAESIIAALPHSPQSEVGRTGLWAWLTFVLRDTLFPVRGGVRRPGEIHKWYPSAPSDYQKAQRHLVRMPVLLLSQLGSDADHLLCGPPGLHSELREQLTSQQDMMRRNFQAVARALYFDRSTGTLKKGAAGKDRPGVARRLAQVRKQLDVTWDMTDLSTQRILELLPPEFDRFRPQGA